MQSTEISQISLPKARKAFYRFPGLLLVASVGDLLIWAYHFLPILYAKMSGTLCGCEGKKDGFIFVTVALSIIVFSAAGTIFTGLNYGVWLNIPPTKRWSKIIVMAKYLVGLQFLLLLYRFGTGN